MVGSEHFLGLNAEQEQGKRPDRRPMWSRPGKHLLVVGPTQTGKTTSVLAHVVRRATGPLITTSTKNDFLMVPTSRHGAVYMLDLSKALVVPSWVAPIRFSPRELVLDWEDALLVARDMMRTAHSFEDTGVSEAGYWTRRASALLAALLWAAKLKGLPIGAVHAWATEQNGAAPLAILQGDQADTDGEDRTPAAHTLRGLMQSSSQASSGVWSFAEQGVSLYAWSSAAERAADPNFDADRFVRSRDTLHIVCPSNMTAEMGPVISILVQSLITAQYRHTEYGAVPDRLRLTLVLDELVNTAALPDLPSVLSEGAGQGVSVVIGTQDRAQVIARYGDHQARSIFDNCRDKLLLGESSDVSLLQDVETLTGLGNRKETTKGYSSGENFSETRSVTSRDVPLWSASALARLPEFRAVYLRGGAARSLIELVPWDRPPYSR